MAAILFGYQEVLVIVAITIVVVLLLSRNTKHPRKRS